MSAIRSLVGKHRAGLGGACVGLFLLSLVRPFPCGAWSNDSAVNDPVCVATANQEAPAMTTDGQGGAIVAWGDKRSGNADIYVQRISGASGAALWTAQGVALCTAVGEQSYPSIISDGNGGAIVVWTDQRSGNKDIYAQHVNASGTPTWTGNGVALATRTDDEEAPSLASDGSGGAIVAWRDSTSYYQPIYAQRVTAAGSVAWTSNGVAISTTAGYSVSPHVVPDGNGGAVIAWTCGTYVSSGPSSSYVNYDAYIQRVNSSGVKQWGGGNDVALCTDVQPQESFSIAGDGSGGAFVAWEDFRSGTSWDIYACKVSSSGTQQGAANGVAVCTTYNHQISPEVMSDGTGGAFIIWPDYRAGNYDLYARRMDSSGSVAWQANGVRLVTGSWGSQMDPKVVSDGAGGAIIVYNEHDWGGVSVQRMNSSGTPLWNDVLGVWTANAADAWTLPAIVPAANGGAIIAWTDTRNGSTNKDIYCALVSANGNLGGDPSGVADWTLY